MRSFLIIGPAILAVIVTACGAPAPSTGALASRSPTACEARVDRGVLPDWARSGFSDPEPAVPHVVGNSAEIAAILFGDPLSAPPSPAHTNKVLWVARRAYTTAPELSIHAQRMDGATAVGDPVERQVEGGPGPSTVDLPQAGCWRLTLSWAGRSDTLDLEYVRPA